MVGSDDSLRRFSAADKERGCSERGYYRKRRVKGFRCTHGV